VASSKPFEKILNDSAKRVQVDHRKRSSSILLKRSIQTKYIQSKQVGHY